MKRKYMQIQISAFRSFRANPPDERYSGTTSLAPRIYEGGGPRSGRGSLPAAAGTALSVTLRVPAPPEGKPRALRAVLAPRIYEGGGPRSGRGSPPPQRGRPSQSRFACQLSQRGSRGRCAPFLPPAFMRGEGRAAAGGVLRRSGDGPLSHGFAVPAPPEGKPRVLRTVLAPRIYEGGGPRSGGGSSPAAAGKASSVTAAPCQLPQRGSRGRFAPFLHPAFMRGEGHAVAGGVPPPLRERPSQSRFAVPAPPEGKPRAFRTVLAPRIYEGGGPHSGRLPSLPLCRAFIRQRSLRRSGCRWFFRFL